MRRFRWSLLGLLLLAGPAGADALSAYGYAQLWSAIFPFVVVTLGLLLLGFIFSVKDFFSRQTSLPTKILLGVNLLVGLSVSMAGSQSSHSRNLFPNPWTKVYLPFTALVLASNKVLQTTDPAARIRAIMLVLAGALALAGGAFSLYFPRIQEYGHPDSGNGIITALLVLPGVWLAVLRGFKADLQLASESASTKSLWWLLAGGPALAVGYLVVLQWVVAKLASWNDPSHIRYATIINSDNLLTYFFYAIWGPIFYFMFWGIDSRR